MAPKPVLNATVQYSVHAPDVFMLAHIDIVTGLAVRVAGAVISIIIFASESNDRSFCGPLGPTLKNISGVDDSLQGYYAVQFR
jgi:hypothetical protein